ncbi:MAG: carboxypeptidase-like regulatory domain-containing protein, partial [Bacteroidetes bacterium]|nr:carboxypeptidase-like regulatory domain-containing protein [Bacteroidota bacterium]
MMLFVLHSSAQTTSVNGKIVDAITREPLPFVNVIFKGTTVGAASDIEGNFAISTNQAVDSIVVSYVGYNKTTKAIKKGVAQQLNVALTQGIDLITVEVRPGENPAWRILRKIIAHKDDNNKEKLESYEYEVYNKV